MGASPDEAEVVLTEVLSPPRVTTHAARFPRFGVIAGGAYDLRPGPDGRSWDFERSEDRAECERRVGRVQPLMLIGCHPCADWSIFNRNLNHGRMAPAEVEHRRRRARVHLEFMLKMYRKQLAMGHPLPPRAPCFDGLMGGELHAGAAGPARGQQLLHGALLP